MMSCTTMFRTISELSKHAERKELHIVVPRRPEPGREAAQDVQVCEGKQSEMAKKVTARELGAQPGNLV